MNRLKRRDNPINEYGAILFSLIIIFVILSFSSEYFFTAKNMQNVLRQLNTNALLAFGMTFILISGCIDLTLGSMMAFSSVMIAKLMQDLSLGFWPSLLLTLLAACLCGLVTGLIVSKTNIPAYIVTLAMQFVIRGTAYIISDAMVIKVDNEQFLSIGNGNLFGIPYPTLVFITIGIAMHLVLTYSRFGRHLLATGGNNEAAVFAGIDVGKVRRICYVLSAVLAAIAGILASSRAYSGQPTLGQGYETDAIAAAVLGGTKFQGGKGSIIGTLIGVCIIGLISNGLNLLEVGTYYQMIVKGLVILVAVFVDTERSKKTGG